MSFLTNSLYNLKNQQSLSLALEFLNQNKIIAFPTDTIYGMLGSFDMITIEKINLIKQRPPSKPYLCILPENYNLNLLVDMSLLSKDKIDYIKENSSQKNTFILPKRKNLFYPKEKTIAIRFPSKQNSQYLFQLLAEYKKPIIAPSLNISNEPVVEHYKEIPLQLANQLDAIFYLENYSRQTPSSIWDLTQDKIIRIR